MKTVLVTGSNGLLGQKLTGLYKSRADVRLICTGPGADRYTDKYGYTYESLDVTDPIALNSVVEKHMPACIIHTAAMTNVDAGENDHEGCDKLNVTAVKNIVDAANRVNAHLIALSTDFIFDGENGPYSEEAEANPLSYYGNSKLKGEHIVMEASHNWAIARTVLVYGIVNDMSRSNIVLWAKDNLSKGKELTVVDDQFRTPTLADDLAKGCMLIEQKEARGIFNISGKDFMSVYELVNRVADYYGLDKSLIKRADSSSFTQPARRPLRTGFIIDKARKELGYEPHSFEEGIALMDKQLEAIKK